MVKTLGVVGTVVVCVGFLFAGQEAADAAKKKDATVRELLAAMELDKMGSQIFDQMGQVLGPSAGADFEGFWKRFRAKVRVQDLIDLCVPIYSKNFTQEEVEQLLAFYRSPIGKKLVEKQPELVKESMTAGMEWGRKIGEEAMKEFERESKKDGK